MNKTDFSADVIHGVENFLTNYIGANRQDRYIIAYAPDSRESAVWLTAGLKARGISAGLVIMRPLVDNEFADRIHAVLPDLPTPGARLVIVTLERDSMSHFEPLKEIRTRLGDDRCQIVRVISASREFFTEAVNLTPIELSGLNAGLLAKLQGSHQLHVESHGGTDLRIEVDSAAYDWISNRGIWRPGSFTILPAGEIATYPARIDGILVADGAVNCNVISRLDMRLNQTPISVTVEDGAAVSFECANAEIHELVSLCFERRHGRNLGELGFGTNTGIRRFIPHNSHINERRSGVHLGFGQHNQDRARVAYVTDIHLDLITDGARIHILDTGESLDLAQLEPTAAEHPQLVRDEDIVEDCCGFGYGQLRDNCAVQP